MATGLMRSRVSHEREVGSVGKLLRAQLLGEGTFSERDDMSDEEGAERLLDALPEGDLRSPAIDALLELVVEKNPQVQGRALSVLWKVAGEIPLDRLLGLLSGGADSLSGVTPAGGGPDDEADLATTLRQLIALTHPHDERARDALRQAATDETWGTWATAAVAREDGAWVVDHATEVVAGDPTRAGYALFNLRDRDDRRRFVERLRGLGGIEEAVTANVGDPAERQQLMAALNQEPVDDQRS